MSNDSIHVYPDSMHKRGDSVYHIEKDETGEKLVVAGPDMDLFEGETVVRQGESLKRCSLTESNSLAIRKLFSFTNPQSHKGHRITIGLGDRLGVASGGHIRIIRDLDVFPVLAQQSIRELNLTGRTYEDVLISAVWAVFREGYTKGYGADGDHLKTYEEVEYALGCGYSMITLDCSEHIRNDLADIPQPVIDDLYAKTPDAAKRTLESEYLNRSFHISNDIAIEFEEAAFRRMVLIYLPAINHAIGVYNDLIKETGVDFEVSIDETLTTTSPQSHFFVANELIKQGVEITSLAPRFVGEFQKGIDYLGDVSEFEYDFDIHARIADKFGYKISVHSGSDKFSIFPIVGRLSGGKYHLKTAGTNWLEAVRVIAGHDPQLYREMHAFALKNLSDAKKYYHISGNTANIADLETVPDERLPDYLDKDDSRQVLHITYGLILMAKTNDGGPLFRDRIYRVLSGHEAEYYAALEKHIGRHLAALQIRK